MCSSGPKAPKEEKKPELRVLLSRRQLEDLSIPANGPGTAYNPSMSMGNGGFAGMMVGALTRKEDQKNYQQWQQNVLNGTADPNSPPPTGLAGLKI